MIGPNSSLPQAIGLDSTRENDNLLVLFPERFRIATVAPSEGTRLLELDAEGVAAQLDRLSGWDLPVSAIEEIEARVKLGNLVVAYRTPQGQCERQRFFLSSDSVTDMVEEFAQEQGANWVQDTRSETALGLAFASLGLAVLVVLGTYLLYLGIQTGWITRGPALLALLVNFLGLGGLIVVGGLLTVLLVVIGLVALGLRNEVIRFRKAQA